jgi:enoyl-CoA hydratase
MTIGLENRDGTTVVTIDRPPVNALDLAAIIEIRERMRGIADGPPPGGMVLTGAGAIFSAGVDTRAFRAYSRAERQEMVRAITAMTGSILELPCPVVAAVNGHALGGGLVLALCADFRLASDRDGVQFGLTEAAAGVPFPAGPRHIIAKEIPHPVLRRMALSSRIMSARDLLACGVLDELCGSASLVAEACTAAKRLAAQPAFAAVKRQIRKDLIDEVARARSQHDPMLDIV